MSTEIVDEPAVGAAAEYWTCLESEYFSDGRNSVSNSDRECWRESPDLYKGRIIDRLPGPWQFKVTEPMKFGTTVHHAVLGTRQLTLLPPELLTESAAADETKKWREFQETDAGGQLTLIPPEVLGKNGAKSTNAWRDFQAAHAGETLVRADEYQIINWLRGNADSLLVTPDEYNAIGWIRDRLLAHARAYELVVSKWDWDKVEQPLRWSCAETGLVRRAKLDRLVPDVIVDLKTFGKIPNARNWASRVEDFGYARQAAYYQDATEALGLGRLPVVFVVMQTQPPYSCATFDLLDTWLERARREVQTDIQEIKAARETGLYVSETNEVSKNRSKIITIDEPRWATYESEYTA